MHELPVIKSILDICLKHATINSANKILTIELKVGEMSDLEPEWMQRYFDFVSKGSIAEGAKLVIEKTPVLFQCDACSHQFKIDIKNLKAAKCPECGTDKCTLISGSEYYISNIGVI
ncbi:MAG: hydrogenase maturation nickel metallochaperone HypA [Desulfobacterium sp.]|nr:hydrogenase maturation nickel metallochaperone HypA [Desulfobacterium sp.]MBU3948766.1 hydrogenase maturation nickel metallochaperone HypA [Pseudomonadota bacterium]MBU4011483.1 hydrogenase maturation nickel metallochaperone HypA [Pseudomonadota bacterium]MBU4035590.1 hydrogenase maturation nickel metallochaperone HypA [Pseudomonadota bacterium]